METASELSGKSAIVTGASSGVGRAMSRALAASGVSVLAVGRSKDRLDALAASVNEGDGDGSANAGGVGRIHPLELDVSSIESGAQMVATAVAEFGQLDIVVANAGIYLTGNFWDAPLTDVEKLIATNVTGAMVTVRAAIDHFRSVGTGDIVVTSSISAHETLHFEPVYNASKHAITTFVKGVRRQLVGSGIRLGALSPATVLNELWGLTDPEVIAGRAADGTGLLSEDVADALLYMLALPRRITIRDIVLVASNQDI